MEQDECPYLSLTRASEMEGVYLDCSPCDLLWWREGMIDQCWGYLPKKNPDCRINPSDVDG